MKVVSNCNTHYLSCMATKFNKRNGMEPKHQELNVSVDAASLHAHTLLRVVWHGMESLWYGI